MLQDSKRIVLTGVGIASPYGNGIDNIWDTLRKGVNRITVRDNWEIDSIGPQLFAGNIEFDFLAEFPGQSAPHPLRYSQLGMYGCKLALQHAGIDMQSVNRERIGLVLNADIGANAASESYAYKLYEKGPDRVSPFEFTKSVSNCALGDIARHFKITGPSSFVIGEHSVPYGYDMLRQGKADIMVCGAIDEIRQRMISNYRKRDLLLSPAQVTTTEINGRVIHLTANDLLHTFLGEASAFVVLETLENAKKRNARIIAEIPAYWIGTDSACNIRMYDRDADDLLFGLQTLTQMEPSLRTDDLLYVSSATSPGQMEAIDLPVTIEAFPSQRVLLENFKFIFGETFASATVLSVGMTAWCLYMQEIPGWRISNTALQTQMHSLHVPSASVEQINPSTKAIVTSHQLGGNVTSLALAPI